MVPIEPPELSVQHVQMSFLWSRPIVMGLSDGRVLRTYSAAPGCMANYVCACVYEARFCITRAVQVRLVSLESGFFNYPGIPRIVFRPWPTMRVRVLCSKILPEEDNLQCWQLWDWHPTQNWSLSSPWAPVWFLFHRSRSLLRRHAKWDPWKRKSLTTCTRLPTYLKPSRRSSITQIILCEAINRMRVWDTALLFGLDGTYVNLAIQRVCCRTVLHPISGCTFHVATTRYFSLRTFTGWPHWPESKDFPSSHSNDCLKHLLDIGLKLFRVLNS